MIEADNVRTSEVDGEWKGQMQQIYREKAI